MWPTNVETVQAFLTVSSQWKAVAGIGGLHVTGLDYAGVRAGLQSAGFEITTELWRGLQVMEAEARHQMNRKRN